MDELAASVIIPTRNRSSDLRNCIIALEKQHAISYLLEVIVIDDHSCQVELDENCELIAESKLKISFLRLPGGKRGPANARNLGIESAKGSIICFLDDDAIPNPEWLQNLLRYFADNRRIVAISGRVNAVELGHPLSLFRQVFYDHRYEQVLKHSHTLDISHRFSLSASMDSSVRLVDYLSGGNSAVRSELLKEIGGFDTAFVMMHDKELALRILSTGGICVFASDVVIKHVHTKSVVDAVSKSFVSGRMQYLMQEKYKGKSIEYHLSVTRPFQKLLYVSRVIGYKKMDLLFLFVVVPLLEYLHQLGYIFALMTNVARVKWLGIGNLVKLNSRIGQKNNMHSRDMINPDVYANREGYVDDDFEISVLKRLPNSRPRQRDTDRDANL